MKTFPWKSLENIELGPVNGNTMRQMSAPGEEIRGCHIVSGFRVMYP